MAKTIKNIYQALASARQQVEAAVPKNGFNSFHKYKFAKANDVIASCRQALNAENVLIIPMGLEDREVWKGEQVIGGNFRYKLIGPDGSELDTVVYAAGEDKGDKSAYKLMTGAIKYLFIQLFLLETDDDPENDSKDKPSKVQKATVKKPAKPSLSKAQFDKASGRVSEPGFIQKLKEGFTLTKDQESQLMEMWTYHQEMSEREHIQNMEQANQ